MSLVYHIVVLARRGDKKLSWRRYANYWVWCPTVSNNW